MRLPGLQNFTDVRTIFRGKRPTTGIVALLCLLAGSAIGLLVVPRAPSPEASSQLISPELDFLGAPLLSASDFQADSFSEKELIETAKDRARDYLERTFTVAVPGSTSLALPLNRWGAGIDEDRLRAFVLSSTDPSSPQFRLWEQEQEEADAPSELEQSKEKNAAPQRPAAFVKELPLPLDFDWDRAAARLIAMKERTDRAPQAARYDVRTQKVVPHIEGRSLDVDATLLAMLAAAQSGQMRVEAIFVVEAPSRKTEELKGLSFDSVLGHFETRYSRADKAKDRTFNLALAAKRLDGTVLFPGEEFDFNSIVGPRDEAHGYKVAAVIADGELVDGIGGGTCQISGTLHGAAFFSGLDIVERYPHTRPSSYIKMGMDATVVYPTINFRFKNSFDFPVVIHQIVEDGVVRAEVRGAGVDQVVSLVRKIDEAIPFEEIERKDPRLPKGNNVLAQRGVPGFHLHRYRTVRRGSHTIREKWRDIYPPTAQVIRVGTGGSDERKQSSVGTPEYRADEVLIVTLKRGDNGEAGEFAENREPGKYGSSGWTKEAGMPFWSGD